MDKKTKEDLENQLKSFTSFSINRVPVKTFQMFKELAEKEFCSDYGMTLKWLMDNMVEDWKYLTLKKKIEELKKEIEEVKKNG